METSKLRNKFIFFIVFAGIITLLLILFHFVEAPIKDYLTDFFGATDRRMGDTATVLFEHLFRILKIVLWMSLIVSIVRFVNHLVFSTALQRSNSYEISSLLRNVFSIIIYIVSFFVIFNSQYPNVDLAALFTTSTILGVIIGLALQDTLGNLFSGLAIQADQPFQIGDVISIPTKGEGVVEQVSWRGVQIRTFQNRLIVISNSVLGKEVVEVAPRDNLNARLVFFNTLYANSPTRTIQAVREVVRQIENVSQKIRPAVRVINLGDSGIEYEVKYWLEDYSKYNETDALIRQRIWYAFQRERIEFAYPTRTLHIETKPQENVFVETSSEIYERLSNVPIFAPLSDEETRKLADGSNLRVFAPGEAIVRQGQKGDSMFVVHRGAVDVQIKEAEATKNLRKLREGDFFGEMGLLTGEPRTATVLTDGETEILEINSLCLKPILEENPELVESLSRIVEERRQSFDKPEDKTMPTEIKDKASIFNSIKKFFGLAD
ncbi:MAG: cAMP-binding proteins - catabolite gene activator and regulatory subunit of cAMP-dependent protein kinases [uncultured Pyrinomonadaceae bacterium]|uniref:cAMP-binding proteins - catabolite gene activator and regulatory subunit of cAMP-dependent protein kinases n=1 Tax=uncultured Pyrinomonadaceae bacterium TaxID=2283094 RepID=A0A6J4P306_9BACT|nr:MAG: cAMP-binding proteins - catabolite gene activator and regulatory subunit of cAMP-dependent protein kinases [uncultured Pyrinomonadaceae bacterium]